VRLFKLDAATAVTWKSSGDWDLVPLDGGRIAAISRSAPFLQLDQLSCCVQLPGAETRCDSGGRGWTYPRVCGALSDASRGSYTRSVVIPIRTAGSERRRLHLGHDLDELPRWQITTITGVPVTGALPTTDVILGGAPAEGSLTLTAAVDDTRYDDGWPPMMLELPTDAPLPDPGLMCRVAERLDATR
jgi:hypothetical protein